MSTQPTWITPAGEIGTFAVGSDMIYSGFQFRATPSAGATEVTYKLLSGALPTGGVNDKPRILADGTLTGIPVDSEAVAFTVRATDDLGSIRDRSFTLMTNQNPAVSFLTPEGLLISTYDSTWVSFQFDYTDFENTAVVQLVDGELPPGLTLSSTGLLQGYPLPPFTADGVPTQRQYFFKLSLTNQSSGGIAQYSIVVTNQNYQQPTTVYRQPTILNYQPIQDPNFGYDFAEGYDFTSFYIPTQNIGTFTADNYFTFKVLGWNFDNDTSYVVYQTTDPSGRIPLPNGSYLDIDRQTGWITGTMPSILESEQINFTIRVTNPDSSDTFQNFNFSLVIEGTATVPFVWETDSDLGEIVNGTVSTKSVLARNGINSVAYRLDDVVLRDLVRGGDTGVYVAVGDDGALYSSQIADYWEQIKFGSGYSLVSIAYGAGRFIAVGSQNGFAYAITSVDGIEWNPMTDLPYGAFTNFNDVIFTFDTFYIFSNSAVLSSPTGFDWILTNTQMDAIASTSTTPPNQELVICVADIPPDNILNPRRVTFRQQQVNYWYTVVPTKIPNGGFPVLNDVATAGDGVLVIGNNGYIARSETQDLFTSDWTTQTISTYDLLSVADSRDAATMLILTSEGRILRSTNDGVNWTTTGTVFSYSPTKVVWAFPYFFVLCSGRTYFSLDGLSWQDSPCSPLPPNLVLSSDGEFIGKVAFEPRQTLMPVNEQQTYTFNVTAYAVHNPLSTSTKAFSITVTQATIQPYQTLYMECLPSLADRVVVQQMIDVIPSGIIYRDGDPYFGKARGIIYEHEYGVYASDLQQYIAAINKNFYDKILVLGELSTAQALDENGNIIYEVVYSKIIDNQINTRGQSIPKEIVWPRPIQYGVADNFTSLTSVYASADDYVPTVIAKLSSPTVSVNVLVQSGETTGVEVGMVANGVGIDTDTYVVEVNSSLSLIVLSKEPLHLLQTGQNIEFGYPTHYTAQAPDTVRTLYPNSLPNMRTQIDEHLGHNRSSYTLPLWMSTQQPDGSTLGYTPAWVICYTKPGMAQDAIDAITANWNGSLNDILFSVDRFTVDRSMTYRWLPNETVPPTYPNGRWEYPVPSSFTTITDQRYDFQVLFPRKNILPNS